MRYACLWLPHLPAVALVRRDPALAGRPLAVVEGEVVRVVVATSPEATAGGVRAGMSPGEAEARQPGLILRPRDPAAEAATAGALLDLALGAAPRVEVAGPDQVHLDLAGLPLPPGGEAALGERLRLGARSLGLPVRVGIAGTRTAAALAARLGPEVSVIPPGAERTVLGPAPVALLEPDAELAATLERWGIRTLGELAALPPAGVLARLGPPGLQLLRRARGEDPGPFVPYLPEEPCAEALALDWEVTTVGALAFVLRRLLEALCLRLEARGAGAAALRLTAGLADGGAVSRRVGLMAPVRDARTLLGLLLAELEGLALPAPIVTLRVEAEPVPFRERQGDLFAPPGPGPQALGVTLGRLATMVGADRVGRPVLGDTHRPTALALAPFRDAGGSSEGPRVPGSPGRRAAVAALALTDGPALVCRRLSPPRPATVTLAPGAGEPRPVRVDAPGVRGEVVACAGPWRTAGEWWAETAWAREEWDVALTDGAVYRLVHDLAGDTWQVDAVYD